MKPILIIDPGHGGADSGGGSNSVWKEKDFNLRLSKYQYNRYRELDIPVAMTRMADLTLSPETRVKKVLDSGAKYCHSNHVNSGGGDGAEVIHSIHSNGKMAGMIADELSSEGQNVRRVFTRTLPTVSNQDYYYMNRKTGKVETIIIEYGFADSQRDDVPQLTNSWERYAEAVVRSFCKFTGYAYRSPVKRMEGFIGKRVESKVDGLRFYNRPSWSDGAVVNTIDKGIGFPEIVGKVRVGDGEQYKVHNSRGEIFYLTANSKYVLVL
ncbi:N-acetylmuramoyl-L-alanine amidase family protein [Sediminibacillus massiliensis]|uniref:N-acetylmuramoyl-L-alanine amidase family protein n=1 Tax=Sediminibacillus massiliensis TaxID=1926277 RepID=UPI000988654C|nr:N-acetylmuramoyl-L-alanine amidase [Sediminibacillus massiliensis]